MGGKRHGLAARRDISAQLAKQRKLAIGPDARVSLRDARTRDQVQLGPQCPLH
jgi:hypothetical protein